MAALGVIKKIQKNFVDNSIYADYHKFWFSGDFFLSP
jgi:hypothetical protein